MTGLGRAVGGHRPHLPGASVEDMFQIIVADVVLVCRELRVPPVGTLTCQTAVPWPHDGHDGEAKLYGWRLDP